MSNEFGYIPEGPEQSFGNNKGIFTPTDIYDLTRADKYTNYGQLELIHTENVNAVNDVDFLETAGTFDTSYNVHFVTINNWDISADGGFMFLRMYENGTLQTGANYDYANQYSYATAVYGEDRSTVQTGIRLDIGAGNQTNEIGNAYFYLYNAGDNTKYTFTTQNSFTTDIATRGVSYFGSGVLHQASLVNGFRINYVNNPSAINNCTISLYGIKEYS